MRNQSAACRDALSAACPCWYSHHLTPVFKLWAFTSPLMAAHPLLTHPRPRVPAVIPTPGGHRGGPPRRCTPGALSDPSGTMNAMTTQHPDSLRPATAAERLAAMNADAEYRASGDP